MSTLYQRAHSAAWLIRVTALGWLAATVVAWIVAARWWPSDALVAQVQAWHWLGWRPGETWPPPAGACVWGECRLLGRIPVDGADALLASPTPWTFIAAPPVVLAFLGLGVLIVLLIRARRRRDAEQMRGGDSVDAAALRRRLE